MKYLSAAVLLRSVLCVGNYDYSCTGNCDHDVFSSTSQGVVLVGGGEDVAESFSFQAERSGGGDYLVLRSSGDGAYNDYIYGIALASGNPFNSVATLVLNDRSASSDDFVLELVKNAEALWFAGGDQSEYVDYWRNTPLHVLLQQKASNITIGGTSAGCALLGDGYVYSAEGRDSATSPDALDDPFEDLITFQTAFLHVPNLARFKSSNGVGFITDTHFVTRDRMGRMITFIARLLRDGAATWSSDDVYGIGVDENTAWLVDSSGFATIAGSGTTYVCHGRKNDVDSLSPMPSTCLENTALTFEDVSCMRLTTGDTFDFRTMLPVSGGVEYTLDVVRGSVRCSAMDGSSCATPYGPK